MTGHNASSWLVTRYQSTPKKIHILAAKIISIYLRGTMGYGLWDLKGKYFTLIGCTDADWANCIGDRKSTSGGAF